MRIQLPGVHLHGEVDLILRDVTTGHVVAKRKANNLTDDGAWHFFRNAWWASQWDQASTLGRAMYLLGASGTGTTPQRTRYSANFPFYERFTSRFNPGVGTGTITGLQMDGGVNSTPSTWRKFAEVTLDEPLEKGPNHELTVVWTVYEDIPTRVSQKVFPGGQRDGVTDVLVTIFIPDSFARATIMSPYQGEYPSFSFGTSNEPSNIETDPLGFKGNNLGSITATTTSIDKGVRLTARALTTQINGPIGEMIVLSNICRVTFDPPLDKTDTFELQITVDRNWSRSTDD